MKKLIFLLVVLVSSMQHVQSQQIFALHEPIAFGKDGTIYLDNVMVTSWEKGIALVREARANREGTPDDHMIFEIQTRKGYVSDPSSVIAFNKGFADGALSLEEFSKIKEGFYMWFIHNIGGGVSKVLLIEVKEGVMKKQELPEKETLPKEESSSPCEDCKVIIPLEKVLLSLKEINKKLDQLLEKMSEHDELLQQILEKEVVAVHEEVKSEVSTLREHTFEVNKRNDYVHEFTSPSKRSIQRSPHQSISAPPFEPEIIPNPVYEEEEMKVNKVSDWPVSYFKMSIGWAYEMTDVTREESAIKSTPLMGLSAGYYFEKHIGIGAGFDYSPYARTRFITTPAVTGGSVHGLIIEDLDGYAIGLYAEGVIKPVRQFSFTGIIGVDALSLTAGVIEDILRNETNEITVRGVPFKAHDLRRFDLMYGWAFDYCFKSGFSLGFRFTQSLPGKIRYPSGLAEETQNRLLPYDKADLRGMQISLGWQFMSGE